MRAPGKTFFLYLGRGKGFEGLWSSESGVEADLRVKDKFLDYLRSYMVGRRVKDIQLDTADRVVQFQFIENVEDKFLFFYKGRELYFANSDKKALGAVIFTSWKGPISLPKDLDFSIFDEVGRTNIEHSKESQIMEIEGLLEDERKAQSHALQKIETKLQKKVNKKIENIKKDLVKVQAWKKLLELIEKEDLSQYPQKTKLAGHKFTFKNEKHFSRCSQVHDKIKKLKSIEPMMLERLALENKKKKAFLKQEKKNSLTPISPVWKKSKQEVKLEDTSTEYKVHSFDGFDLGVGKSAQGNDQMRAHWGKKEDWWVHAEASPSAHVIIKIKNPQLDLINILPYTKQYLSDLSEVDVVYTKVKNLKSVKGSPGKVIFKKEKRLRLKDD